MVHSRTLGFKDIGVWVDVTAKSTSFAYLESVDAPIELGPRVEPIAVDDRPVEQLLGLCWPHGK